MNNRVNVSVRRRITTTDFKGVAFITPALRSILPDSRLYQVNGWGKMEHLFVYGTLQPGQANAHILEEIGGEWRPGFVTGTFYDRGWGAAEGFPGIVRNANGGQVQGYLFMSKNLRAHWPMLDEFEDGYDRVEVKVTTAEGQQLTAWIYQLQPQTT